MMYTLGIDLGSSYLKAAVFCLESQEVVYSKSMPAFRRRQGPYPELFEISAEEIFQTVKELVDSLAGRFRLSRILLSTQMHGFVYRTPSLPEVYISWQDARSTLPLFENKRTAIEELSERLGSEEMQACGVPLKPSLGLCNLYALLYGQRAAPEGGELFTLGSYLIWRLTGQNVCHLTNAAPLGIVDVKNHQFHSGVLQKAGLGHLKLPRLAESDFTICGVYAHESGDIPVLPDYGDQQVSILGSMANVGDAVLNIATAGQLCHLTSGYRPGPYEIRPYFEHEFLYTISNMPSGRNLDVLVQFIQDCISVAAGLQVSEGELWKRIDTAFQRTDTDLQVDALFYPTQTQFDGGSIRGIKPLNFTLMNLLTATYDNMAEIYARHIPVLMGETPPKELVFSGGVSWKNDALVRIIAEKIGLPFRKSAVANEVIGGMYRLSMVSCGLLGSLSERRELVVHPF